MHEQRMLPVQESSTQRKQFQATQYDTGRMQTGHGV